MAATPSTMLELGSRAPEFRLPNVDGKMVGLPDFHGKKGLLVAFICNHCPYVKHIQAELTRLGKDLAARDIGMVGISSNDVEKYPQDAPELMKKEAEAAGYTFPYLFDSTQEVAKAYRAACTPDFYLFDADFKLVYRGQLDDSRPSNDKPVTGKDIRSAVDALLDGKPIPEEQTPSIGCNIKWKPGNEPDYFA